MPKTRDSFNASTPSPSVRVQPREGIKLTRVLDQMTSVHGLAWSPTGKALVVSSPDGRLVCWPKEKGAAEWSVQVASVPITDLCFAPDGRILTTYSPKGVWVWTADGQNLKTSGPPLGKGSRVAWSSTERIAIGGPNSSVKIWDTHTWEKEQFDLPIVGTASCMSWSADGSVLIVGSKAEGVFTLANITGRTPRWSDWVKHAPGDPPGANDVSWMPGTNWFAMAGKDRNIYIRAIDGRGTVHILEGHTAAVTGLTFSFDGKLLASRSLDNTVRLFRTDTWGEVARINVPTPSALPKLAFSPCEHSLAIVDWAGGGVGLWEIDLAVLLGAPSSRSTIHEVSAKVVLVGEGRAGKSCLALRLAKDKYEELDSTHGMRFWSMPAGAFSGAGPRRELILWDLGGQSEYQLVHQLFLRDSAVALMVMDPGRGGSSLEEVEGWDRRLHAQSGERDIRKLLVGTKVDTPESPVNRPALEAFVQRLGFDSYALTSAKTGRGIEELKKALGRVVDWSALEQVSRPELFQHIRDIIQRLREARRVVLTFFELEQELRRELGDTFEPKALEAVVGQLARQGRVADTRMAGGTRVLILEVEQIERYAGSLIVAARENPYGVPAVEMAKVLSPQMKFPRIRDEDRLTEDQEIAVLNCVIELLIEHGVCLRHEGLLIFPSLFPPALSGPETEFSHSISLHYDFFGATDNIYASLVTALAIGQRFGRMRLWGNRAEFGQAGKDSSGLRRVQSQSQGARGIAQLDVYFDEGTDERTRELFVNFVEQHLREQGVELSERLSLTCVCGKVFSEDTVRQRLSRGLADVGCEDCDRRIPLMPGAERSRELHPELVKQVHALRTTVQKERRQSSTEVKATMTKAKQVEPSLSTPLRILHLSDLHVGAGDDALSLLQPLRADLQDREEGLGVERLDYLVISGDITNRASPEEFEKAREFVSQLIKDFGLTAERCILVPGNHDLDWNTEVYTWRKKRQVDPARLVDGSYREQGDGYLVRDDPRYPERFKNFSDHFYHPLMLKPYPLPAEEQCLSTLFPESRLQFLALNSAWEIDEYFRERSSIDEKALSRGLDAAERELREARKRGELTAEDRILRVSVLHHPVTGNEKIHEDAFLERLCQADVRVCLHGHVHEDRADVVRPRHSRKLEVLGAGSFGAPTHERPESVPRLYNLLEVRRDLQSLRVHTRCLRKHGGAWEGWAVWPGEEKGARRTYYDVPLP